jgi:tripartite-type tricarboxylate transporter receptor subunit TctC
MKLPRRRFLHLAAGAAALPAVSRIARAQAYPSRPVHLMVGFPPGTSPDTSARLAGQMLTERLGQSFVIENRPGAAGNLATEGVAKAIPDGYTLLLVTTSNTINATLYDKLNFDFIRDIVPVAGFTRAPNVMVVHPSFPAKTVPEFIAYAKANVGKINFGSAGVGSTPHVSGELFNMMTGTKMIHIPYLRSRPMNDLLGGQLGLIFSPMSSSLELVRGGRVRALAVTSPSRTAELPEIPTVDEFVPGYEASTWEGIGAPSRTPTEIIDRLNREINAGLADSTLRARLASVGVNGLPSSSADFGKLIAEETEKWGKVVKFSSAKPD